MRDADPQTSVSINPKHPTPEPHPDPYRHRRHRRFGDAINKDPKEVICSCHIKLVDDCYGDLMHFGEWGSFSVLEECVQVK